MTFYVSSCNELTNTGYFGAGVNIRASILHKYKYKIQIDIRTVKQIGKNVTKQYRGYDSIYWDILQHCMQDDILLLLNLILGKLSLYKEQTTFITFELKKFAFLCNQNRKDK